MTLTAERARPQDLAPTMELLRAADLPTVGISDQYGHYFVIRDVERVVGAVGLEVHEADGLLRALVVVPGYRGQGGGAALVAAVLGLAARLELDAVYLLTTTARAFFARHGFEDCPRDQAPEAIRQSWEFRSGCPDSAAFMRRKVEAS